MSDRSPSDLSYFHCTSEWHFARMRSALASPLHNFSLFLSKRDRVFWPSAARLADYFGVSEKTVRRTIDELLEHGFFVIEKEPLGKSVHYRPVPHTEWKDRNPGKCTTRAATPWDGEAKDPLAVRFYTISGGETFFPGFIKGARNIGAKLGMDDVALAEKFGEFFLQDRGGRSHRYMRFMKFLREASYP